MVRKFKGLAAKTYVSVSMRAPNPFPQPYIGLHSSLSTQCYDSSVPTLSLDLEFADVFSSKKFRQRNCIGNCKQTSERVAPSHLPDTCALASISFAGPDRGPRIAVVRVRAAASRGG